MLTNTLNVWMIALGYGLDNLFCLKFTVQFEIPKKKKFAEEKSKCRKRMIKLAFLSRCVLSGFRKYLCLIKLHL